MIEKFLILFLTIEISLELDLKDNCFTPIKLSDYNECTQNLVLNLNNLTRIVSIEVQGTNYEIIYQRQPNEKWFQYKQNTTIIVKRLRINAQNKTTCLKVTLYGCSYDQHILWYEAPKGYKRGIIDYTDKTYDGLGQLTDGQLGHENYLEQPNEWIAWKRIYKAYVELVFQFDSYRNFSSISIHTLNRRSFKHISIDFDGLSSFEADIQIDFSLESTREIRINLNNRIGKLVRLRLFFLSKWMFISEIKFESNESTQLSNRLSLSQTQFYLIIIAISCLIITFLIAIFIFSIQLLRKHNSKLSLYYGTSSIYTEIPSLSTDTDDSSFQVKCVSIQGFSGTVNPLALDLHSLIKLPCLNDNLNNFLSIDLKDTLVDGRFGKIIRVEATYPDKINSLIGKVLLNDDLKKQFLNEVYIKSRLYHPNLCNLVGYSEQPYCLLSEYSSDNHLDSYLKENQLNNEAKQQILIQITSAMKYLESLSICHRDLALRNCLIDDKLHLKLSDIAICLPQYKQDYFKVNESTLLPIRYMSPEALFNGIFTCSSDIWSFGILAWQLYITPYQQQPFNNLTNQEYLNQLSIQQDLFMKTHLFNLLYKELRDIIYNCFEIDTCKRPTFKELNSKLKGLIGKNDKALSTHLTISF